LVVVTNTDAVFCFYEAKQCQTIKPNAGQKLRAEYSLSAKIFCQTAKKLRIFENARRIGLHILHALVARTMPEPIPHFVAESLTEPLAQPATDQPPSSPPVLSQALQDYLKVIYKLGENGNVVTTNDIARELKLVPASVTNMLKRLAELRLCKHASYKGVALSESGRKAALEIIRHHRLLELYLQEALGYSWDKVHEEAEHLEHHISEEFEDRIAAVLGNPTHDPHGDPIPAKDGTLPQRFTRALASVEAGVTVTIRRVSDTESALLRYCAEIGLVPYARVLVVSQTPIANTITLHIAGKEYVIGSKVAEQIFVE
jgi:DtxR family Mn-dependent transcriptional regulator